ncbi:MAG: hypothetical protein KBT34_06995 [Prevotella sp.]|nr:hypothetical protein [Candidatus Prevotella equi]
MIFSVSLQSHSGDKYYVYLTPLDKRWWGDLVLPEPNLEIYQIVLDRLEGGNVTDMHIIQEISKFIANVFLTNDVIFYYVCDDLNEIPNANRSISPQEYRSRLFSRMFDRYINSHGVEGLVDTPIIIKDAVGNNQYVHIISRDIHIASVNYLVNFIEEGFTAGK